MGHCTCKQLPGLRETGLLCAALRTAWRAMLGTVPEQGMERVHMVGWARGGAPPAAAEQAPAGLLVSIRNVVEENRAQP